MKAYSVIRLMNESYGSVRFYMPVNLIFGDNVVSRFGRYHTLGNNCLIVTGRNLYKKCSVLDDIYTGLENCGVSYTLFNETENNPSLDTVYKIVKTYHFNKCDFIIGAGGGSSMDAAKAAALLSANPDIEGDDIFDPNKFRNPPLPLILIGTTAGTGSEVTKASVLTFKSGRNITKKTVKSADSYAKYALCDFKYTYTMTDETTYSTALDTVSHAAEAYFSKKCGEIERLFAVKALKTVKKALNNFRNNEKSENIRRELYIASLYAGMAINGSGTSLAHSMGYQLTSYKGVPHGAACAVFLTEFLSRMSESDEFLKASGFNGLVDFDDFISGLLELCQVRYKLSDYEIADFSSLAVKMPNINNHTSKPVGYDECRVIYSKCCG